MSDAGQASDARLRSLVQLAQPTAHDVRGALNALQLHIELLAGIDANGQDAGARLGRHVGTLRSECARLHRLVESFFDQIAMPDQPASIPLGALLDGVVSAAQPAAKAVRAALSATDGALGSRRPVDRERCRQLVLDALLGALERAPAGATVCLDLAPAGDRLVLAVDGTVCAGMHLPQPMETGIDA